MTQRSDSSLYKRHRYPAEIISHAISLYLRFPLSFRMVEDMLTMRGIIVSHQTIRDWVHKFGPRFAGDIRRRSAGRFGDKWHLDEVVITICGRKHGLWRAVDQNGFTLDALVQSRRNKQAAKRLMRELLKRQGQRPRVMLTDKLSSYSAAKKELMSGVEHRAHKGLNNHAENSHQPVRFSSHNNYGTSRCRREMAANNPSNASGMSGRPLPLTIGVLLWTGTIFELF